MLLAATKNFLVPNLTFVFELVAFLLVLAVLGKYVMPPLQRALNERQDNIRRGIEDAEHAKQRAAQADADYNATMDEARAQARATVDEARRIGEQVREEARQRGEQEAQRIVAAAHTAIQAETRRAADQLRHDVTDLVIAVVTRVVGDGLDVDAHRALIDRTIGEVEAEATTTPSAATR